MTVFYCANVMLWNSKSRCKPALLARMSTVPNSLMVLAHVDHLFLDRHVSLVGDRMKAYPRICATTALAASSPSN